MKKSRNKKRIISLILAFSMTFALPGCGKDAAGSDVQSIGNANQSGSTNQTQGESGSGDAAMGRYVETEIDLSDKLINARAFCKREDGSLVIIDEYQGFFISQDKGDTWTLETPDWMISMLENYYYISDVAMAPDGTVGVIYDPVTDDDGYTPVMDLILQDGERVPVELALTEDDMYISQMVMTKDNRIFIYTLGGNIYEVYKDGSGELLPLPQEKCQTFYIEENLLIKDRSGYKDITPMLYDVNDGQEKYDEVLAEFVRENYSDRGYNGTYYCSMYILQESDSVLYLIGGKGIHRHVVGGNMMEQVVDGNLSMLSNPSYSIISALMLEEDEFIVLFSNHKLLRFIYDPNIPAVPENVLTIYSLREDEDMRQAVSMYQSKHPDTFVSYKIGIADGSAVTREDALKKLNTEIMAGTGPDLIVLDEMPFDSYVEKGLLLDLTDYLREYSAKEPLYDNIIDALKVDGKAYAAPATFNIPILMGRKDILSDITDLDSFGEAVEILREEHPGNDIIGICDAVGVMNRFAAVSAPEWLTEGGTLNKESIGKYLEQCKCIYYAQMDGIGADTLEAYARFDEQYRAEYGESMWRLEWPIAPDIMNYISGNKYLLSGWLESPRAYDECISLGRTEGYEDSGFIDMQGECMHVFKPNTLLGISAVSTQPDAAKAFMDFFLSAEAQGNYYSFSLNKAAYESQAAVDENFLAEDGAYSWMSRWTEDGISVNFTVYLASEEQTAALQETFASLNTAYIQDGTLEDAVFESGSSYIRGEMPLGDALDKIEKQVAIYMAE